MQRKKISQFMWRRGPCGGCDVRHLVIGEPEKLDVQELIGKLEKMNPDDEFDHI